MPATIIESSRKVFEQCAALVPLSFGIDASLQELADMFPVLRRPGVRAGVQ
jgi:hypothetical protein